MDRMLVQRFESVSSTNDLAIRMAEEGAPEGTVVIALEQTAGKGRYGRHWVSPADGLYLSIVLRPDVLFDKLWQTAFVSSLAACEAIGELSGLDAQIKWPNDVLLNGRKVCGILVEALAGVPGSRFKVQGSKFKVQGATGAVVIVGIGVNVNNEGFPAEIAETATSIALEVGHPISMGKAEESLLSHLDSRYEQYTRDGFDPILEAWRVLDCTAGRSVAINTPEGPVSGTALEVEPSGNLILQRDDGSTARITAGDVMLRNA